MYNRRIIVKQPLFCLLNVKLYFKYLNVNIINIFKYSNPSVNLFSMNKILNLGLYKKY